MSIQEKKSVISVQFSSTESIKRVIPEQTCDTVDSDHSFNTPNHKLSLEFRCSNTPSKQRKLCESFWKVIDQHPELDRIIARGWFEKEGVSKTKPTKKKTPTPSYCDELQEFLDHNVDKIALLGLKNLDSCECSTKLKQLYPFSSDTHPYQDLQDFDVNVKTVISIPPKAPRPTRSEQDVTCQQALRQLDSKSKKTPN